MNSSNPFSYGSFRVESDPVTADMIEVYCHDRWAVYQRLQELDIGCSCGYYQPLRVQVSSVAVALQIWSVLRQATVPRPVLAHYLERCWQA